MTDQPYTPTTEEIRDYVEMGGEPRPWEPPTPEGEALEIKRREAFDRWLAAHDAAIESAAEQRGAVRHLREVASELNMHHLTEDLSDSALKLGVRFVNLIQDRADQMEGDDV